MDAVYLEIRKIARKIVARYPRPAFYHDHPFEVRDSRRFFQCNPSIIRLRKEMAGCLDDDFGHGMGHVEKVAIDAGTLVIIESRLDGQTENRVQRNLLLAQCAGLLHDICRKEKSHAEKGAEAASDILKTYPLVPDEITHVCTAIRNHEAFAHPERLPSHQAHKISDCLYDADKFRWGPDNFNHTLWDMVSFLNPPLATFVDHYPKGMALLKKIRGTFRSRTGRLYGPQFIDMGLAIGEELFQVILTDFINRP
ncbi:HD domain-containing protein [uncultured Desulfosarcina sp.]|uniref:HD domain-containing protein n=1 Tax=uncultured Desulfosarcina sp. TaxID=218289 RepID=UPI0029C704CA|nr:HD domain-containing protein [uncultured Desulfosarcina sp.]